MTLQSSGAISLANIQTEFGGANPISLSEYYRGAGYTTTNNTSVPTSGTISIANFYGTSATQPGLVVDVLILAGGGGGGGSYSDGSTGGGGGGAGGLRIITSLTVSGASSVVIGAGGYEDGGYSYFMSTSYLAFGGGGGGSETNYYGSLNGRPGGSGGGAAEASDGSLPGSGTPGQGNNGGPDLGGGGGYSSAGSRGSYLGTFTGDGGTGYNLLNFAGSPNLGVAGGGAGQGAFINGNNVSAIATDGGGTTDENASINTGGGGGGATAGSSRGYGGSGRVMIRYPGSTIKATGGVIYFSNIGGTLHAIHDFTTTGTFTPA
jgi:hypothetical protein